MKPHTVTCIQQLFYSLVFAIDLFNGYGLLKCEHTKYAIATISLGWAPSLFYVVIFLYTHSLRSKAKTFISVLVSLILPPLVPIMTGLLAYMHKTPQSRNLAILCGLVVASMEAGMQLVNQGFILSDNQIDSKCQLSVDFGHNQG